MPGCFGEMEHAFDKDDHGFLFVKELSQRKQKHTEDCTKELMKSIKNHHKKNCERIFIKTKSPNSKNLAKFREKQKLQQNNREDVVDAQ